MNKMYTLIRANTVGIIIAINAENVYGNYQNISLHAMLIAIKRGFNCLTRTPAYMDNALKRASKKMLVN